MMNLFEMEEVGRQHRADMEREAQMARLIKQSRRREQPALRANAPRTGHSFLASLKRLLSPRQRRSESLQGEVLML